MRSAVAGLIAGILLIGLIVLFARGRGPVLFPRTSPTQSPSAQVTASPNNSPSPVPINPLSLPLQAGQGMKIGYFAKDLPGGARDLQFSPGGTLLVSIPSKGEVVALPDKNRDGSTDNALTVISGLNHPHGLAFFNGQLFVAEVDRVSRYNWNEQTIQASLDKVLFSLPENSDHNARTLTFDSSGNLYVSVGSTCNVCHESSPEDATVMISNANGDNPRIFAGGLRNAAFIQINPKTGELWGTEMGRDYLGDNTPPDEINIIKQGQNYGWPYCYGDKVTDTQFIPSTSSGINCQQTVAPIYQIPAHSAPLGLTFINSPQFPPDWQGDLLVAYHGSWNRSTPTGYKVVHMKVSGDQILSADDFITDFEDGAVGRPVDLTFDKEGNLFLSDDKSDAVYIIGKR